MNRDISSLMFWFVAAGTILSALGMLFAANPIYCALFLAVCMSAVAALFFMLGAYFVAAVQLMVYAGAVMVLFVLVLMLFDLKTEKDSWDRSMAEVVVKMAGAGALLGFLIGGFMLSRVLLESGGFEGQALGSTKQLAALLFSKHVFGFEIIGVLLLIVIVGAVALSRARGGTHA